MAVAGRPEQLKAVRGWCRALLLAVCAPAALASPMPGTPIINLATLSSLNASPVQASVVAEVAPTLELMRYAPQGSAVVVTHITTTLQPGVTGPASNVMVEPTGCSSQTMTQPAYAFESTGSLPALPAAMPIADAAQFNVGEPLYLRVEDQSANLNPLVQDHITITIANISGNNDHETLTLTETDVNSGIFVGFIDTNSGPAQAGDCKLSVGKSDEVQATYAGTIQAVAGLVDPYGVVFDSKSGAPLSNVRVSLINDSTGQLAQVYGDDGAVYPAQVITGSTIKVGSLTYVFPPGQYRFPYVSASQNYRLVVDELPPGYVVPSAVSPANLQNAPNGPYSIDNNGSYGKAFLIQQGPPQRVDIPADKATTGLFVVKSAESSTAAAGDFVPYDVQVTNTHASTMTGVVLTDVMPAGFHYRKGTFKVNGVVIADPTISPDGRTLTANIGSVPGGSSVAVNYIDEVTAATPMGVATNVVQAQSGGIVSNQSQAAVIITDDLMQSHAILTGRVWQTESCEASAKTPLKDARIYLEDGRYALTDKYGKWHFDNINPGTHVVQLDKASLPADYEVLPCEKHTRSAGNTFSQFVDVQGGTLWQTDFYVRHIQTVHMTIKEVPEKVSTRLSSEVDGDTVHFSLTIENADAALSSTVVNLNIPRGLSMVPDSLRLDGAPRTDIKLMSGTVADGDLSSSRNGHGLTVDAKADKPAVVTAPGQQIDLGDLEEAAHGHVLTWDVKVRAEIHTGEEVVQANVLANVSGEQIDLSNADNKVSVSVPEQIGRVIIFRPHFASYSTILNDADRKWLNDVAKDLRNQGDIRIEVVGHTDNVRVVPRKGHAFADNYSLSAARAKSVADYLQTLLKFDADHISSAGKGPDEPIADNKTKKGRDANRRVELKVFAAGQVSAPQVDLIQPDSGEQVVTVRHWIGVDDEPKPAAQADKAADVAPARAPTVDEVVAAAAKAGTAAGPDSADKTLGILSLKDGDVLADRIYAVRVRLDARLTPVLMVDGKDVPADRIGFKMSEDGGTELMSYIGVDFGEPGPHELTVQGTDPFGNARYKQTLKLQRAGEITRIHLVSATGNVADGKTPIQAKIELIDASGKAFNSPVDLKIVSGDLQPQASVLLDKTMDSQGAKVAVGRDGIVSFAPVSRSGLYTVTLGLGNVTERIQVYVKPEKRDWIVVGLAQGSLAEKTLGGNMEALNAAGENKDIWQDGRVAFYAKGQVKGDWLLTVAYDTAKQNNQAFGQIIDPTQYYTLYSDSSSPRYDAASTSKLYIRIEKDAFYALFGDFNTGMSETKLSQYNRTMTGLKSEYHDKNFDVNVYGADSSQAFTRTELRGDGTSGLYHLGATNILPGSDKIWLETRDRYHPDVILSSQQLTGFADYSLDYVTGDLFFKAPVMSQDANFNPIYIVAEYEQDSNGKSSVNAGGRAAVKLMDGKATVGVSLVKEGDGIYGGQLKGLDAKVKVTPTDTVSAEIAQTNSDTQSNGSQSGEARLLEWQRTTSLFKGRVYYNEQDPGFGLGQQSASLLGLRTYGAEGRYQVSHYWSMQGDAYQQDNIVSGASREVEEIAAEYKRDAYSLKAGLRNASDNFNDGITPSDHADQLTLGGTYNLIPNKVTLRAESDIGIQSSDSQDFPDRLMVGADYKLSKELTLNAQQQFTWSQQGDTTSTSAGAVYSPWKGANFGESLVHEVDESGDRIMSSLGLGQRIPLSKEWTLETTYDRSDKLAGTENPVTNQPPTVLPGANPVYGPASDNFWAAGIGGQYHADLTKAALRIEHRDSSTEIRWNAVGGIYRELDPQLAIAGGLQLSTSDQVGGVVNDETDLRWSLAYRPDATPVVVLNRVDVIFDRQDDGTGNNLAGQRLVNNFNISRRWARDQLSFQYGAKYVFETADTSDVSGYTDLTGLEWRHDLNETWDVGAQTSLLHTWASGVFKYSYGISAGFTPVKDTWVSVGFNFAGVTDKDFSAAEYTAQGIYLKVRAKFDQDSLAQIWQSARNGVFR